MKIQDYAGLNRDAQMESSADEAAAASVENRLKDLHTCLPGIIDRFDPETQTASVQPAIKRIFTERGTVDLPLCMDVPVSFPGGGDFFLTFPVKPGDECLLLFSERCIDAWHFEGGTQPPEEFRLHDLSDAIALVGLNSQPKKIPAFNATDTELRNRFGDTHLTMQPDGAITAVNPQGSYTLGADGSMTITAPAGTTINSPQIVLNGNTLLRGNLASAVGNGGDGSCNFAGDVVGNNISLDHHTHPGDSGGTTGEPNP
jgi:hypothetical protein